MAVDFNTVELCAGAGGEALGLETAGFHHACLVEIDSHACNTLRLNRPSWNVSEGELQYFDPRPFKGATMVSGGLPCPPYSVAGRQLGPADERDLFGHGMRIIDEIRPKAAMLENVKGILDPKFESVRNDLREQLRKLGYKVDWRLLNASDFGVPQLRPRVIFVALQSNFADHFTWPVPNPFNPPTVGETLLDLMSERGWRGAGEWAQTADDIAPTLVGGSKLHGGPDLGPTRARKAWARLGVNGKSLSDESPALDFLGMPRLTVRMAARLQGFPDTWQFAGRKTAVYRQVANAFPPPVAAAVGRKIHDALRLGSKVTGSVDLRKLRSDNR